MKPLKSVLFRSSARIQRAANLPFNAFKPGFRGIEVQLILMTLRDLQKHSASLPTRHLPHPQGSFGPPGAAWGPFILDPDFNQLDYGFACERDFRKFQKQAGNLGTDGLAGMETIHRLDELQFFLEASGLNRA